MESRVTELWGETAAQRSAGPVALGWLDSPLVEEYVAGLTGAGSEFRIAALVRRLGIPPTARWLSVGCGAAAAELLLAEQGLIGSLEGLDIAPGAVAAARAAAERRGIRNVSFRAADVERERLGESQYDVVLCAMSLHHIRRLEFFLDEVSAALRPGGWLILDEYVGPSQWQWTDAQLAAVNAILPAIPERLRRNPLTGEFKVAVSRPTLAEMDRADPSESVRSGEIIGLVARQFELVERRDYGGALLHKLLEYIVGNFDPGRREDAELLRLICACEQALVAAGALQSDFTLVAARSSGQSGRRSELLFDESLDRYVVRGLYPVERSGEGRLFCWAEPHAELALERPPWARVLELDLVLPPAPRAVRVTLGGAPIGCLRAPRRVPAGRFQRVRLGLPPPRERQPTIGLEADTWSPAEIGGGDDRRALGVAIAGAVYR
ncbi:MAG: hypothetical protein RLZZ387_1187 [Chloroflexota bacterium]|jgi:SAM-dependent methyltransferase